MRNPTFSAAIERESSASSSGTAFVPHASSAALAASSASAKVSGLSFAGYRSGDVCNWKKRPRSVLSDS